MYLSWNKILFSRFQLINYILGRFIAPSDGVYFFVCNAIMTADNGNLYVKHQRGSNTETVCLAMSRNDDDGRWEKVWLDQIK